jgi:hypothetical protein
MLGAGRHIESMTTQITGVRQDARGVTVAAKDLESGREREL